MRMEQIAPCVKYYKNKRALISFMYVVSCSKYTLAYNHPV